MTTKNFGELVREIAEKQGISQVELADRSNVSRVQINRIFSGTSANVRPATRSRIAAALGLDEKQIRDADVLQSYRKMVLEKHLIQSLAGLGFAELQRQPLNTFYVPPLGVRNSIISDLAQDSARLSAFSETGRKEKPRSAVELILATDRSVVLGVPGSGKTTLIQFLATESASGNLGQLDLPIVVRLPEFALALQEQANLNFFDWFVSRAEEFGCFDVADPVERRLANSPGSLLFLFDGLDEVPDTNDARSGVVNSIESFVNQYPEQRYVITSRLNGFDANPWGKCGFLRITLQEYGEDQIRTAVQKWSTILSNSKSEPAAKIADELSNAIFENPRVKQLAGNPLILTILILMCKARGYALPRRRVDLYAKVTEVFLDSWEASKRKEFGFRETGSIDLDTRELNWLIAELALAMQRACLVTAHRWWIIDHLRETLCDRIGFDAHTAKKQCDPILRFISARAGLLEERLPGVFAFTHRTMQEYFAAIGLIEEAEIDPVKAGLCVLMRPYLYHPEWSEVVRLVAAQVNPPRAEDLLKSIVEDPDPAGRFLRRGALLAFGCLADGATVANRRFTQSLFDSLEELGRSHWLGITMEFLDVLQTLSGTRHEEAATEVRTKILESAKRSLSDEEFRSLAFAAEGPMRIELETTPEEGDAPVLKRPVTAGDFEEVSYFPNFELFNEDPDRWQVLAGLWIERDDVDESAKKLLIWHMLYSPKENRKYRKRRRIRLKKILQSAKSDTIKATAARALGNLPIGQRDAVRYLLKRFVNVAEAEVVRVACAIGLTKAAATRGDVQQALIECLTDNTQSEQVRRFSALGLEQAARNSNKVARLLLEIARSKPCDLVAAACVSALESVGEVYIGDYLGWVDEASVRSHAAAMVLAELYASGRAEWNSDAVRRVEEKLISTASDEACPEEPSPQSLSAIQSLVSARERLGGLRMESVISEKLRRHHDKISYAFVYGSVARNDQELDSDIDLMLIGTVTLKEISRAIKEIQSTLGRQVNPTVYSIQNFATKRDEGNPFIEDVMRKPKLFIEVENHIPTEEELLNELGTVEAERLA